MLPLPHQRVKTPRRCGMDVASDAHGDEVSGDLNIRKKLSVTCRRSHKTAIKSRFVELAAYYYDANRRAEWDYSKERLPSSQVRAAD